MPIVSRKDAPLYQLFLKEIKFITLKSKIDNSEKKAIKFRGKIFRSQNRREVFEAVKKQIEQEI